MNIVTLMDFPDDGKYNWMCMIWLKRVLQHAPGARVRILTAGGLPGSVRQYAAGFSNVVVERAERRALGELDHYNLSVKLFNVSQIREPFLFLDADMFVISDLDSLWAQRGSKPFIGVYDPVFPGPARSASRNLNSGMQLVSDPAFYDYDAIVECFNGNGRRFVCAGEDQALLTDYFHHIGYDFTHPSVGFGWNACSRFVRLSKDDGGAWRGVSCDQPEVSSVHIVHYWNGACRPWNMDCPLFAEEVAVLQADGIDASPARCRGAVRGSGASGALRVHVMNAPPHVLACPEEPPFHPVRSVKVERVDSPDAADVIFWRMNPEAPGRDYEELIYKHSAFFKANEDRFVMYTAERKPAWCYVNNALCLVAHPMMGREKNRLANVVPVPYLLDCVDTELLADVQFIAQLAREEKRYDVACAESVAGLVRSGCESGAAVRMCVLRLSRKVALSMPVEVRRDLMRQALLAIARSRYYVYVESDEDTPLLLYHAMMVGTVPVVVGLADLPFEDVVPWRECAVFPRGGISLSGLLRECDVRYAAVRQKALDVWRDYIEPSACNDHLIQRYLCRR